MISSSWIMIEFIEDTGRFGGQTISGHSVGKVECISSTGGEIDKKYCVDNLVLPRPAILRPCEEGKSYLFISASVGNWIVGQPTNG